MSYAQEGQLFHVLVADGVTFLCMADEASVLPLRPCAGENCIRTASDVSCAAEMTCSILRMQPLGRRIPFAFLEDVRQRFFDEHAAETGSAEAFSLNDAFAPILAQRMVRSFCCILGGRDDPIAGAAHSGPQRRG